MDAIIKILAGLLNFFLQLSDWCGGFVKKYNDKAFEWAYKKYNWEEEDGDEEEA